MDFDVYCDESRPDLLSSEHPQSNYMVIGSLWLPAEQRQRMKNDIHALRDKHHIGGEFKWQKVSPSKLGFYRDLVDWFIGKESQLRFRCIVVDSNKVDLVKFHNTDQELGFYKFYYQMLHHWILDFNEYSVFCDFKSNRVRARLHDLQRCLDYSNLSSNIAKVQAVRSRESVLLQAADVFTGIAASKLNDSLLAGSAKWELVSHFEQALGKSIGPTYQSEQKFNVFKIDLDGGW